MNQLKHSFIGLFTLAGLLISSELLATCLVTNDNDSGSGSLRSTIDDKLDDGSNSTCRENDGSYRIWFDQDTNDNGYNDWDTIELESSLSLSNSSREMIIGNNSTTITIDARGGSPSVMCIFSVSSGVDLTLKNLEILVDAGLTEDDIICGSGAAGVDLDDVMVEPAEEEEEEEDNDDDLTVTPVDPGTFTDWFENGDSEEDEDAEEDQDSEGDDNSDDGSTDSAPLDRDGDGYTADVDCNDVNSAIYPSAEEIVDNGIDDNCDGLKLISVTPDEGEEENSDEPDESEDEENNNENEEDEEPTDAEPVEEGNDVSGGGCSLHPS